MDLNEIKSRNAHMVIYGVQRHYGSRVKAYI